MAEHLGAREHTYGLMGVIRSCCALPIAFGLLVIVVTIAKQVDIVQNACAILLLVGALGLYFVLALSTMIMFPSVVVVDGGMKLQLFWFWCIFVPWDSVLDLHKRTERVGRTVIVAVERLTPFHLLYGLVYVRKLKPAFLISASITGYDHLIETIELQTGKRLNS
jgi:hypothetical protein